MFKAKGWLSAPTFLPVLSRELRENSHRAFNYYLRVFAGALALALMWSVVRNVERQMPASSMGLFLFSDLHTFLLLFVVCVVPIMTADCISEEKRNGTLGLLFLTPLTARGIMIGKSCAHAFRAFTFWLSVLPVLVIPFLLGGISWFDVGTAITMEFCGIIIALAAGLFASAVFRKRNMAVGAACTLSIVFNLMLAFLFTYFFVLNVIALTPGWKTTPYSQLVPMMPFVITGHLNPFFFGVSRGSGLGGWSAILSARTGYTHTWVQLLIAAALVALLFMCVALIVGAWQINRSWRDRISRVSTKWSKRFCTPIFLNRFRNQMRRLLDHNPIAWLQQYSWRARATKWGLCLAFVVIETFGVSILQNQYDLLDSMTVLQVLLLVVISLMFVFVGVSSFQTEKQSGALELILITPLRVRQIIFGRVYGLWKQFLPAFLVVVTCHIAIGVFFFHPWRGFGSQSHRDMLKDLLFYLTVALGFLNLPIFATYFALRVKNMIAAGILTGVVLCLAPVFGVVVFVGGFGLITGIDVTSSNNSLAIGFIVGNIAFAGLTVFLLYHSLSRRIYSF